MISITFLWHLLWTLQIMDSELPMRISNVNPESYLHLACHQLAKTQTLYPPMHPIRHNTPVLPGIAPILPRSSASVLFEWNPVS